MICARMVGIRHWNGGPGVTGCGTNIWRQRTAFFAPRSRAGCCYLNPKRLRLAEIAHRLGRRALADMASAAKPDTLFRWYRELIAKKFDGSRFRKSVCRPPNG
jgi:hypothetical protein